MTKRKKYRYVLCGLVSGSDKISDFRLIASNNIKPSYNGDSALRVNIPDDLKLTKWTRDAYSTTNDNRTLDELGYDILIWDDKKKKWNVRNDLKGTNPCDFHLVLDK